MKQKFFACRTCGKMVAMVKESECPTLCCGEKMVELIPGAKDASKEKHVPVVHVDGNRVHVQVGAALHPMSPEHLIEWISVRTTRGNQRRDLVAGDAPEAEFLLSEGESVEAVYAYCNLHGLWMTEICK